MGRQAVGLEITFFNLSFLIPSLSFVMSMMVCIKLIGGGLHFRPLLLQLPEQIPCKQPVFHESIRQSVLCRVTDTFLSFLSFTAGTEWYSAEDSSASSHLQRVSHGWISGSNQAGDISNTLLDEFIEFLLDFSNHGSVREHVHEAVATDMTVKMRVNELWRTELPKGI